MVELGISNLMVNIVGVLSIDSVDSLTSLQMDEGTNSIEQLVNSYDHMLNDSNVMTS